MRKSNEIIPEFKARLRKVGTSYVVTVPMVIKELWGIGEDEEIYVTISDSMRIACFDHVNSCSVLNLKHLILKKREAIL